MDSIKTVLNKFDPVKDKYVSREFQTFALKLADELDDYKHRAIYMRLAKTVHRSVLERALSFAIDSNANNKGGLFMWKLKELRQGEKRAKALEASKKSV
ncbi:MAG TPA: hypothetical protein VM077_05145 [Candidatus Limnocylindrales bacterium]|nr:hypothetical protein [Candidatus Limnocylindrales bacterium]